MKIKRFAITMGDPGGIGAEVIVKALCRKDIRHCCDPVVVGCVAVLRDAVKNSGLSVKIRSISNLSQSKPETGTIEIIDIRSASAFKKGAPSKKAGKAAVSYIRKAVELAMNREVDAIVTAPVSKESLRMAGYPWPGHTELLAELTDTKDFAMMFFSNELKLILCTIHVPFKDVPEKITEQLVFRTIMLAKRGAAMFKMKDPRIAVAGLNPHAGEAGIFGNEEERFIIPAVEKARAEGVGVSGPYPPDVVFHRAYHGDFDIVVCMYHDQGLIPFKMIAFDKGVNVTVGLPVIRTSPDHGTAFDIAWKNRANSSSMAEAIKLASRLELGIRN